jgi:DNA-binding MarR family transcriptional regulator
LKQENLKKKNMDGCCDWENVPKERRLGYLIRLISLSFHKTFNKKLERYNLTSAQSDILAFLEKVEGQQATQKEIETHLHAKNPTVTGLLNRLEEKNYVKRLQNPKDKRSHVVVLTEESRKILRDIHQSGQEMETKMVEGLSDEEIEALMYSLRRVLQNIN